MDEVVLDQITLTYHEAQMETLALQNISFSVQKGEFVSIIGPSGCGKSTLLSIIAKLITPSSGHVYLNGKELSKSDLVVGYMLQKDYLFNWRTIRSNVLLGLEIQNKLTKENIEYAEYLMDQYGLGAFKEYKPFQLSGGLKQRAALIRTLAIKPDLLLLDEPFSALDYQTRLFVSDDIATIIRNEKKTAILVTHDISEAISMSDRVIVLSKRPAIVKNIYSINLSSSDKLPIKSREAPEFRHYFNMIWKELDIHA